MKEKAIIRTAKKLIKLIEKSSTVSPYRVGECSDSRFGNVSVWDFTEKHGIFKVDWCAGSARLEQVNGVISRLESNEV